MRIVASYPEWKHTPIVLGESDPEGCAACKGPENGYRNGPLYGVSEAEATMRTYELARKYGVTVEGAVTWAFEFEDQPYFAGFRELATNGIDKPVLNVFRMMGSLGEDWVKTESSGGLSIEDIVQNGVTGAPDVNAVATVFEMAASGSHTRWSILVWNYHDDDVAAPDAQIELKIDGLSGRAVDAVEYRMDASHSNSYAAWLQMGSPEQPTPEQVKALKAAAKLEETVEPHAVTVSHGVASISLTLPRQGVALISFDQ